MRKRSDTDAVLALVRQYAAEHGAMQGEHSWDAWAGPRGLLKGSALRKRFGSLAAAADRAGVAYDPPTHAACDTEPTRQALLAAARRYAAEHGALCGKATWDAWAQRERAAGRDAPSGNTVAAYFGNMAGLARAAGVTYQRRMPRPPSLRPQEKRVQGLTRQQYIDTHLAQLLERAAQR